MERVVVSNNKNFVKLIFGFVFLCFVFGFATSLFILVRGAGPNVKEEDWFFLTAIFQGAMAILFGILFFKRERCFVEWDSTTVRFYMPDDYRRETIPVADIRAVAVHEHKVELTLANAVRVINVADLKPEQLQRVKHYFEELGRQCKKVESAN